MTLGEAKNKVYMLLDEHSAGGTVEHDADIEAKMAFFFDMAQKELAKQRKIIRQRKITRQSGKTEYALPDDLMSVLTIYADGRASGGRYRIRAGKILIPERDGAEEIILEYAAVPETIAEDESDEYEFEIDEMAANCMPYYVAAQQLLPDLVMDYGGMLNMYQMAVQSLPTITYAAQQRVAQTLWR